jgi:hypothetical protein
MSSTDALLQNALLGFAAIYVALALVRIVLQWKQIKAIVKQVKAITEANETQKRRAEQEATRYQGAFDRLEALKQGKESDLRRSEELYRQSEETQKRSEELHRQSAEAQQRWSVILSRVEALTERLEQRNRD